ncbi:hypothetical protein I3F58_28520 [Streptomyces sp. MUM 203J]|nr:hypothetical protein [Streptomyces sp. MUM 203J]
MGGSGQGAPGRYGSGAGAGAGAPGAGGGMGMGMGAGSGAGQRGAVQGRDELSGRPGGTQGGGQGTQPGRQGQQPRDPQRQDTGMPGGYGGQGGAYGDQNSQGGAYGAQGGFGDPGPGSYGDGFGDTAGRSPQGTPAGNGAPPRSDVWQQSGQDPLGGQPSGRQQQPPQSAGWGSDQGGAADGPRGHEEPADSTGRFAQPASADLQGPGSTGEFPRPDLGGQSGYGDPASTAALPRADYDAPQDDSRALPPGGGSGSGEGRTPLYETLETNWYPHGGQQGSGQGGQGQPGAAPQGRTAPQGQERPGGDNRFPTHDQTVPTPVVPQQPSQGRTPPSLPARASGPAPQGRPAGLGRPGRGQFGPGQNQGQGQGQNQPGQAQNRGQGQYGQPGQGLAPNGQSSNGLSGNGRAGGGQPAPSRGSDAASTTGSWRTTPNDELVRQAERARKPAAGGVTGSGLPRRVPRANLVPGTAQDSQTQAGPQVSRAPDDVRGRLTNLRRGIQQGRQAGSGNTGSFNVGPTHQQEREF